MRMRRLSARASWVTSPRRGPLQPPVAVLGGVVEEASHGGGLGREGSQVEIVVGLAEPGLGELQRLVGGAQPKRRLGAEASLATISS